MVGSHQTRSQSLKNYALAIWLLIYVTMVHSIDLLATFGAQWPIDWRFFQWKLGFNDFVSVPLDNGVRLYPLLGADLFKFVAWFLIPFLFVFRWIDWGYFGVKRLKRNDLLLIFFLVLAGVAAVLSIAFVPGLRDYYPGLSRATTADKWRIFSHTLLYIFSWLLGWEFLHRYVLIRHISAVPPRYGWLIVPLIEGAYHLPKHPLEMVGMVVLSVALSFWTVKRRNCLPGFIIHFFIELELLLFMLLV